MATNKGISINIPLFEGKIEVFTDQVKTIQRTVELGITKKLNYKKDLEYLESLYAGVYYNVKRDMLIVVYLPEQYDDVLVSHETIHIITALYKYYDLPAPKAGKDEIFARYHDYFMTQIKKKVYKV